jgi:hypothetical protein
MIRSKTIGQRVAALCRTAKSLWSPSVNGCASLQSDCWHSYRLPDTMVTGAASCDWSNVNSMVGLGPVSVLAICAGISDCRNIKSNNSFPSLAIIWAPALNENRISNLGDKYDKPRIIITIRKVGSKPTQNLRCIKMAYIFGSNSTLIITYIKHYATCS